MKTKQIPAIIMLLAGLVTCIDSIIQKVSLKEFVTRMWIVIILFYILGFVVKIILDKNFKKKIEESLEENEEPAEGVEETKEAVNRTNEEQEYENKNVEQEE